MAAYLGFLVGALIPIFLLSRLILLILKKWDGGMQKILFVHAMSIIIATLIGGMGMADGGAFAPVKAFSSYILPQTVWLIFDFARFKKSKSKTTDAKS